MIATRVDMQKFGQQNFEGNIQEIEHFLLALLAQNIVSPDDFEFAAERTAHCEGNVDVLAQPIACKTGTQAPLKRVGIQYSYVKSIKVSYKNGADKFSLLPWMLLTDHRIGINIFDTLPLLGHSHVVCPFNWNS